METTPTMTMMMAITIATIGRRTKNSAILVSVGGGACPGPGVDRHAGPHALQAFDDDTRAGIQPGLDHDVIAGLRSFLHLLRLDHALPVYHVDAEEALNLNQCLSRHQYGVLEHLVQSAHARELARQQIVFRIRESRLDRVSSCFLVD